MHVFWSHHNTQESDDSFTNVQVSLNVKNFQFFVFVTWKHHRHEENKERKEKKRKEKKKKKVTRIVVKEEKMDRRIIEIEEWENGKDENY
jgi:hypothetical protein